MKGLSSVRRNLLNFEVEKNDGHGVIEGKSSS